MPRVKSSVGFWRGGVAQTRKVALLPTVDRYNGTAVESWPRDYRAALRLEIFRLKQAANTRISDEELLDAAQGWLSTHSRPQRVPKRLNLKHLSALLAGSPPTLGDARAPLSKHPTSPRPMSVTAPKGSKKVVVATTHRGRAIDVSWPATPLASRVKVALHDHSGTRITQRRTSSDVRKITFDRVPAATQPLTVVLYAFSQSGAQVAHGHTGVVSTTSKATAASKPKPKHADPAAVARERAKLRSELGALELRSTPSSAAALKGSRKNGRGR